MEYIKFVWRGEELLRIVFWKYFGITFLIFSVGIIVYGGAGGSAEEGGLIMLLISAFFCLALFFCSYLLQFCGQRKSMRETSI